MRVSTFWSILFILLLMAAGEALTGVIPSAAEAGIMAPMPARRASVTAAMANGCADCRFLLFMGYSGSNGLMGEYRRPRRRRAGPHTRGGSVPGGGAKAKHPN